MHLQNILVFFLSSPFSDDWCSGSSVLCDYISDINGVFSDSMIKELVWPTDYHDGNLLYSSYFKLAKALMENTIIVRLQYQSSEVEVNKLELRTTMSDKIANLGGTYGIWAELTGCSLLGIINLLIISCKLLLKFKF